MTGVLGTVENHQECFLRPQRIPAFVANTHTDTYIATRTQGEKKATCQRSPFILHVSVKDKKLADSRASQTG